jgi:hypothetical protein
MFNFIPSGRYIAKSLLKIENGTFFENILLFSNSTFISELFFDNQTFEIQEIIFFFISSFQKNVLLISIFISLQVEFTSFIHEIHHKFKSKSLSINFLISRE